MHVCDKKNMEYNMTISYIQTVSKHYNTVNPQHDVQKMYALIDFEHLE